VRTERHAALGPHAFLTVAMSEQRTRSALEVRHVSKSFGIVQALNDVSLAIEAGTIHGIVGQNGAGKSTLMQILAGVFPPDEGEVILNGTPVTLRNPDHARRLGIRIIYQELNLVPYQTIAENVFLGIEPRTRFRLLDHRTMRRLTRELLALLGSSLPVDLKIDALNIGQKQLVEIAKALAWKSQLLILDEPTASLEAHDVDRLFEVLVRFREQGRTALYVSHRLNELFQICDRVTVLRDGQLVQTADIGNTSRAEIIRSMIGRPLAEVFPERATREEAQAVLEVRGLSTGLLKNVGFTAKAGRICGIVGLEGSGIRELGRVLIGDQPIEQGQLTLNGQRVAFTAPRAAVRAGIVYLSSDRKKDGLFPILPVGQNISLALLDQLRRLGLIDSGSERHFVRDGIDRLAIQTPTPTQEVRFLSGGNQQKVLLARWLATKPCLFVLDEPTRGIDIGSKAEIYAIMRDLADSGAAVLMISTDLTEVLGMSDEILVLHAGEVVAMLPGGAQEDEVLAHVVGAAA
jgi:ABC-type sugar transport system ATPase subunit